MRTDRHADMTKLPAIFAYFAKAPKNKATVALNCFTQHSGIAVSAHYHVQYPTGSTHRSIQNQVILFSSSKSFLLYVSPSHVVVTSINKGNTNE